MKSFIRGFMFLMLLPFMAVAANARVEVDVNLSTQRMNVTVDGRHYATWRISSGRRNYYTPRGTYRPKWLKRMHYSRKYDNAPMPYSIFFHGGYAIHGTNVVSRLGRPASHGCIRLSEPAAAELFRLVQQHGRKNTIIRITGSTDVAYRNLRASKRRVAKRSRVRKDRMLNSRAQSRRMAARKKARARRAAAQRQRAYARRLAARRAAARRALRRYYASQRQRYVPRFEFLEVYGATITR